jgi:hypothetical protein
MCDSRFVSACVWPHSNYNILLKYTLCKCTAVHSLLHSKHVGDTQARTLNVDIQYSCIVLLQSHSSSTARTMLGAQLSSQYASRLHKLVRYS